VLDALGFALGHRRAPRVTVAVTAVGTRDPVIIAQCRNRANGNGLLAGIQV
jgi:hypothetical protein